MLRVQVENAVDEIRDPLVKRAIHDRRNSLEYSAQTSAPWRQARFGGAFLRGDPLQRNLLRQAIRYVHEHLDSKLKWDDLAAAVGLEAFAFARRFKLATGITPHKYIIHCRMNRALQLLSQSELSLADIALEVGCSSQSYLTALFRKHLDTTPGAYRLSCTNGVAFGITPVAGVATENRTARTFSNPPFGGARRDRRRNRPHRSS